MMGQLEIPKTEPDTPRPTEAPKGQGGLEAEVMKLSPGKDDILVIKLEHELTALELDGLRRSVAQVLPSMKLIILEPDVDIEVIPRRSGHYGVWCAGHYEDGSGVWGRDASGKIFSTPSAGVASAQKETYIGDCSVRIFNDDGTPGEVV